MLYFHEILDGICVSGSFLISTDYKEYKYREKT